MTAVDPLPRLTVRSIRAVGVEVSMTYALGTSRAVITRAPLLLIDGRWRRFGIYLAYLFHLGTYAALTIAFFPHLVAMLSFLELDKFADLVHRRRPAVGQAPAPAPAGT